ncbi:hypothetical protein DUNSADRAFT_16285 [Dunaliella salina]|uniref:Uncharacterized protein n=1 Tax=Dunaliella salina TaxID=3046 RepID=A0ABQ7G3W4_DUNSA|nr:hypothetical protein DUNSADRAFT_16285 [Dunaliella salina]|eukprot:KAF5829305.1 hypothetical protein DUNSADRAFT_16285 [Dunaliella salina]
MQSCATNSLTLKSSHQGTLKGPHQGMASANAAQRAKSSISSARVEAPSCERNKEPILEVLKKYLNTDKEGKVLEVASGTGQHCAHFAPAFPNLLWQPSDCSLDLFRSITAWASGIPNICLPPLFLDTRKDKWPLRSGKSDQPEELMAIYCANMVHISPWAATQGLLQGAGRHLKRPGGLLLIYGPFKRDGKHTSESNAQFDASLRSRDPEWGYHDVAEVEAEAAKQTADSLKLEAVEQMPANNLLLIFKQS